MVHHGLIASSNSIVKDANIRDQVGTELNAICLDYEAAGLMNTLPCLVIRGVADYADTHGNAEWHGYAACAASAYTKKLLSEMGNYTIKGLELAASLGVILSSAKRLTQEPHDGSSVSIDAPGNTIPGNVTEDNIAGVLVAEKVAQVMVSHERLRSMCTLAALRIEQHELQRNILVALGLFLSALSEEPQTPQSLACRWLRRYKSRIAEYMTATFYDQGNLLNADQIKTTSIPAETLMLSVSNRFPEASASRTTVDIAPILDEDVDMDIQGTPDDEILTDRGRLDEILCHGEAFEDMLGKLKELLLPPVHVLLENTLGTYLARTQRQARIMCLVEWELLHLVKFEGLSVEDLDHLFTLSGDFEHTRADTLAGHEIWETGIELLEVVKTCIAMASNNVFDPVHARSVAGADQTHQIEMQLFNASMNIEKEYAVAYIAGSASYIKAIVMQLAWLTANLRVPHEETLTVSCINFQPHRLRSGEITKGAFRMNLWEPDKVPRPNDEPGQCWTQLFAHSVLAYGFPSTTQRPENMRGVEIPFDVMATCAGVRFPLLLGERLSFAGETNVLVPEMFSENSVQWHFDTIKKALQRTEKEYRVPAQGMENIDLSKIHKYRAFLGYSRLSEVVMGTAEFCNAEITASGLPRPKRELRFKNEGTLTAGLGYKGYVTSTAGTTWKFKTGEIAIIEGSTLPLDEALNRSARTPALLYDDQNRTAFLLPELSIVIQMAATYLQNESDLAADQIPRAYKSFDGGKAAYEAVKAAKNLDVPFGTGEPRKYPDIVRDFIDLLEQRKKQKESNESDFKISRRKGLRGWGYTDIQEKSFQFWEREYLTESQPIWWQLFRESNIIVLFAGSMPQPIRIAPDHTTALCTSWDAIPANQHLLLANVLDLTRLRIVTEKARRKNPNRYMLTADLGWARPATSRLFETNCTPGGHCNPLQTMRDLDPSWWQMMIPRQYRAGDYLLHPGQLELKGSVLFADDPRAIKDRPCQIIAPIEPHLNFTSASSSMHSCHHCLQSCCRCSHPCHHCSHS